VSVVTVSGIYLIHMLHLLIKIKVAHEIDS